VAAATQTKWFLTSAGIMGILLFASQEALAHCDTMDGPVIKDAKQALEKGDVTPVLKWVQNEAEPEIRAALQKAVTVRSKGADAKELADTYFFETLVRVHRAGEGAPYEGIKPAGTKMEPGIEAADKALESGAADSLVKEVTDVVDRGIRERFSSAVEAKTHKDESVESGRKFVEAYVTFMHYVERLHEDATTNPSHHGGEAQAGHTDAGQHDEHAQANAEHK